MYVTKFLLPVDREEQLLAARAAENGGKFGYIDNPYPCHLFTKKLSEIELDRLTIFYGGNGSGKSTLLNLMAAKMELNRIAPYNSGEMFAAYAAACEYELGWDDEGFRYRIPNGSRIITSDDIFDYMLTMRTNNAEIAEEKKDVLKVGKVNVDDCPDLAAKYGIMSIPAVFLFKDGKIVAQAVGYMPKDELLATLLK